MLQSSEVLDGYNLSQLDSSFGHVFVNGSIVSIVKQAVSSVWPRFIVTQHDSG